MQTECPSCGVTLNLGDSVSGTETTCPSCGSELPDLDRTKIIPLETTRFSHFRLVDRVGHGQYGDVWLAYDTRLQREVALKLPRNVDFEGRARSMFLREARTAARLEHPQIVPVFEIGEEEGQIFIASQFVRGMTLRDRLRELPYGHREAAELLAQISDAMEYAHTRGIVHRDLKPNNILISYDGSPYVADFGLAKSLMSDATVTLDGTVLGTPAYMSPEQASGQSRTADQRSDIFSLGVILYEMLTGSRPFSGGSDVVLLQQIRNVTPIAPRRRDRSIPRDLETICMRAIEKRPEDRYQTAGELCADLRRFLAGQPIHARPVSQAERSWRWMGRNRRLSASLAALMLMTGWKFAAIPDSTTSDRGPSAVVADSSRVHVPVHLATSPPGARLVFYPVDSVAGRPDPARAVRPDGTSPQVTPLPPGLYLVVAALGDGRFHEVYRTVPDGTTVEWAYAHQRWRRRADGSVELPEIVIPWDSVVDDLVPLDGDARFEAGLPDRPEIPRHRRPVDPFWLARSEVTIGEFLETPVGNLPTWLTSIDGVRAVLRGHEAIDVVEDAELARMLDDLGNSPLADLPITGLFPHQMIAWAEKRGLRLPTEFEYEYAASNAGTTLFPWGDQPNLDDRWSLRPVGTRPLDRTIVNGDAIVDLYSNAAEFTLSAPGPYPSDDQPAVPDLLPGFVVRGGPVDGSPGESSQQWASSGVRSRMGTPDRGPVGPGVGFRCARSRSPRLFLPAAANGPTRTSDRSQP